MNESQKAVLESVVTQCRIMLEESLGYALEGEFGIHGNGHVEDEKGLPHLDAEGLAARRVLVSHLNHFRAAGATPSEAVSRAIREAAFTHLNRLCGYKMLERREMIREAVSRGTNSNGFKFYLADRPEEEFLWALGRQDVAYRHFLTWLAESLSDQINVLFSPHEIANCLWPQHSAVMSVLELINQPELDDIWNEDETIGWIYQYFTPDETRRLARKESSAPRDGHELAFLNQFYTPRYVVEFLVENTLGRLWYDMMKGDTSLVDSCCYLVHTPGKWRDTPKKDPREILIMDPACGSGHFLLYCFDLMLCIYEEAYTDPELGTALAQDFPTLESLRVAAPTLILENNLYGIDIDSRATQIAALALWLRAQRAYAEAEVPRDARPPITKANIICAEPMPGEDDMLEEFLRDLEPSALRPLIWEVFQRMQLAGEAGSLLRIEEEIHDVVEEAKERWGRSPREHQLSLFAHERREESSEQLESDLLAMTTDEFWEEAEASIIESLRVYAEQNGRNDGPFARQLFSEDAGRGFALVDACRKQYDIVLMNPPFGQPSITSKDYITKNYSISKQDVACAFVERWLDKCTSTGKLGAITTRTPFFLSTTTTWREKVVLEDGRLRILADLGFGVLDAMVETAAYVLDRSGSEDPALFIRALKEEPWDKAMTISQALSDPDDPRRYIVNPISFQKVPNNPLCYWVSDQVRKLFCELPHFNGEKRTARTGLSTANDFRFVRLWSEVSREKIGSTWFPFAKGGSYSPYYADLHLVVNWENDGEEMRAYPGSTIRNARFYFRPGLTWPSRPSQRGWFAIVPPGCIFSHTGMMAFMPDEDLWWSLSATNSTLFIGLLHLLMPRGGEDSGQTLKYEVGYVGSVPMVSPSSSQRERLERLAVRGFIAQREIMSAAETCPWFRTAIVRSMQSPKSITGYCINHQSRARALSEEIDNVGAEIDSIVGEAYGLNDKDSDCLVESAGERPALTRDADQKSVSENSGDAEISQHDTRDTAKALLSYLFGVVFGRWDVRLSTGQRPIPPLPDDPCAPLPAYSPGMLRDQEILDGKVEPPEYPVVINTNGILVDDPESPDDIVRKVREVIEAIWHERADEIESEACEILGVGDLREYFRNPRQFFDYHIKQYSRSRRKAPIYWLLQSPKRSYGLWIYYHRLNKDTLFRALAMHVGPKIRLEQTRLDQMRVERANAGTGGIEVKRLERAIDQHEALMSDLHAFRDRLNRAAQLHLDPDLDDGVILNMAPLWELVPWREPKGYWDALLRGEYAWSSIAKQLAERG